MSDKADINSQVERVKKLRQRRSQLIAHKDWPEVLKICEQLLEIKPTTARYCNHSFVLLQLGKLPEALRNYQKALEMQPDSKVALKGAAKVKAMLQNIEKVSDKEDKKEAFIATENDEILAKSQGKLLKQLRHSIDDKDWLQALEVVNRLVEIKPTIERFCNRGFILQRLGRLPEALDSYQRALALNSEFKTALKGVARIKKLIRDVEQATNEEPVLALHLEPGERPDTWRQKLYFLWDGDYQPIFIGTLALILLIVASVFLLSSNSEQTSKDKQPIKKKIKPPQKKSVKKQAFSVKNHMQKKLEGNIFVKSQKKWETPEEEYIYQQKAKGLVLYQDKWVTKKEKFVLQQKAKGLTKYEGKWVTPNKKYALQQKAKGLVFYKNKWITKKEEFEQKQQARGFIKYQGKWISGAEKLRIEEKYRKQIPVSLEKYYSYLRKSCKKFVHKGSVVEAYQKLVKNTQKFEKLFPSPSILLTKKERLAKKKKPKRCSIYPASLYKNLDEFSWILDSSKLAQLNNKISHFEIKFSKVIAAKHLLENKRELVNKSILGKKRAVLNLKKQIELPAQLKKEILQMGFKIDQVKRRIEDLKREKEKISFEMVSLKSKIEQHQRKQSRLERENSRDVRDIEGKIDDSEEELNKQRKNTREIIKEINKTKRELNATKDKNERARLRRRHSDLKRERSNSESLERSLKRDIEDFTSDIEKKKRELENIQDEGSSLRSELSDLKHQQQKSEDSIARLQGNITNVQEQMDSKQELLENLLQQLPELKDSLKQTQQKIISLKSEKRQMNKEISGHEQTLLPLTALYQKRKKIHNIAKKYQTWWTNLHNNKKVLERGREKILHPRKNLLLALYILQNFDKDYYKVKIADGYRYLGIVYVYYW